MPSLPQEPELVVVPSDFGGLVPARRIDPLSLYNSWLSHGRQQVAPGPVSASFIVDPLGNPAVISVSSPDGNGMRESILERALLESKYEPAYITSPYTQPDGQVIPANSTVYSPERNLTVFFESPQDSAPSPDHFWVCGSDSCEWMVRVAEKPSQKRTSAVAIVEESPTPKKKHSSIVPAVIVGAFAGWYLYGRIGR